MNDLEGRISVLRTELEKRKSTRIVGRKDEERSWSFGITREDAWRSSIRVESIALASLKNQKGNKQACSLSFTASWIEPDFEGTHPKMKNIDDLKELKTELKDPAEEELIEEEIK